MKLFNICSIVSCYVEPVSRNEAIVASGQQLGAVMRPQHVRYPVLVHFHDRYVPRSATMPRDAGRSVHEKPDVINLVKQKPERNFSL